MQIKLIYDIEGPDGVVANGWNYNYTNDMWDYNFKTDHPLINAFNKKYEQISIYDCNLNIGNHNIEKIHISDIVYDNTFGVVKYDNSNSLFLYPIHPFGSIDTCIGNNSNYHQDTHCFEFISIYAKKYINDAKNFYLVFDYSSEGDIRPELFDNLHKNCEQLNINPSKVIIITSAMNTRDLYQRYLNTTSQKQQFYTTYFPWPVLSKKGELKTYLDDTNQFEFNGFRNKISFMNEDDYNLNLKRNKKCLIYNRRVAPHRVILLSLLTNDNLLENITYSIDLSLHYNPDELGLDLANGSGYKNLPYLKNEKTKSNMINGFFKLKKIGKSTIDYDNVGGVWGFGFEHKEPYLDTYFSVITETLFYEEGHYISEKSFKGIQHLHPFVIVGKPGILKQLKNWGFKTFSDFWDESYDEIEDDSDRMEIVYGLIKSLIIKSDDEWVELTKKLLPILIHNRNTLLSINEKKFNEIYIKNIFNLVHHEPNQENYSLF